ncbi:WD40 repeat-like protein [Mycena floridula]|nr:WD40 repeat-like protein [Mycena floridula]
MAHSTLMTISADEVNCLIHSYLEDSGMSHTAFSIRKEGQLERSPNFGKHIPRGELVELLGKALLYMEVEAHFRGDQMSINCKKEFSLLEPHVCSTEPSKSRNENAASSTNLIKANGANVKRKSSPNPTGETPAEKRVKRDQEEAEADSSSESSKPRAGETAKPVSKKKPTDPELDRVRLFSGHKTEVFVCAFNPMNPNILASGSKDATVNIWEFSDATGDDIYALTAPHRTTVSDFSRQEQADLTSLHWSPDGTLLAVGSYDSVVRICTTGGEMYFENAHHQGPIFTIRFSKTGRWLVSASLDHSACLWDVKEKKLHRQYTAHTDCCLDVDWLSDDVFASCGADQKIHICRVDEAEPVKILRGHANEINQIKSNRNGTRLASCSDDMTTRVWNVEHIPSADDAIPGLAGTDQVVILKGHLHSVSTVAWCPPTTQDGPELLATASFDGTARLWNPSTAECLKVFVDHRRPVYALSVSPDGTWLASGSGDGWLHIYALEDKKKKWSWYAGVEKPGIFEVSWQSPVNGDTNRFALALESRQVAIMDLPKILEIAETS